MIDAKVVVEAKIKKTHIKSKRRPENFLRMPRAQQVCKGNKISLLGGTQPQLKFQKVASIQRYPSMEYHDKK